MNRITYFLLSSALALATSASAAEIFTEEFTSASGALNGSGVWAFHSGTANQIQIISTASDSGSSLFSTGIGSNRAIGNRITINGTDSEDINRTWSTVSSAPPSILPDPATTRTVYAGFYMKQTVLPNATGTYFAHFMETNSTGNFGARLWTRSSGGGYQLGILSVGTGTYTFSPVMNLNQTYYVVVKLSMNPGATNDSSAVFLNPAPGSAEPAVPFIAHANGAGNADISTVGIGRWGFRQAAGIGTIELDSLRVATTWPEALPVAVSAFSAE